MNRGPTLCAAGLALLVATSAFAQSARIEVVPAEWAFGQVEEGESFQKTLEVRNRGDAPLIIHRVDPGCGCLSARIFQLEIAPGGAAPLHLALSTTGREGALGKSVILETNDPAQPETRIRVTGLIAKRMWFEIPSLDLGEVPPGSRPSTEVILQVRPGLEAELEDSDFSMEGHEIEAEPFGELEGEHGYRIRLTFPELQDEGRFEGTLRLRFSGKPPFEKTLSVRGTVLGPLEIRPRRLAFGRLEPGTKTTMVVSVRHRAGVALELDRLVLPDPRLSSKRLPSEFPDRFVFELTLEARAGDGDLRGQIELILTQPEGLRASWSYYARVRPQ